MDYEENDRQAKTDEERYHAMAYVPYTEWQVISRWEDEAKSEKYRKIFHDKAISLYHMEEDSIGEL